jgi:ribosome-associated protein
MSESLSRRPRTARSPRAKGARLPAGVALAVEAARGKKAVDLVLLDLRKSGAFTDFFVIATGANARQVQAIADEVEHVLKANGIRPSNIEGHRRAEWVLIDCFDFVVHVFSPAARSFYGLERLWAASTRIPLHDPAGR